MQDIQTARTVLIFMQYLHKSEKKAAGGVADGLLGITQALNASGDKRIEVQLEVLAGQDGGGGEGLKSALSDPKVVVLEEIQADVDERRRLRRRQALSGRFQKLVEVLHPGHPLLRVLRPRELQCFLHFFRRDLAADPVRSGRCFCGGDVRVGVCETEM